MQRRLFILGAALTLATTACTGPTRGAGHRGVPLFDGLGDHGYTVTTSSALAQEYFDQGLVWAYAFNHDEAIRSFGEAARLDPQCAMAWWGIALCHGPHINNPMMTPERSAAAWEALQRAVGLSRHASATERRLIDALSARYASPPPADRSPLDRAYADAMRDVWVDHPDDADIGALYAEALMDLHPWDLWTQDRQPKAHTAPILDLLEAVIRLDPENPLANHLYIHAVEASYAPERADAAADRLRRLVPGSGHLVHMPSHIDVLTGRWAQAADQNVEAMAVDARYRALSPDQGFYNLYMVHNSHMLSFAAMMEGRAEVALAAARRVVDDVPEKALKENAVFLDPIMGAPYDALRRFGQWDALLREPAPARYLPITTAMWRFNRALAHAARGDIPAAKREKAHFLEAAGRIPEDAMMAINPAHHVLDIAEHMLDGEIAFRRGDVDGAVAALQRAIALEDGLVYMEPPEWVQPVRHTLGAVLVSAGRFEEAERVYREDLEKWPENGWSLYGLSRCLASRDGAAAGADAMNARFRTAWARADTDIASSCLCIPGR